MKFNLYHKYLRLTCEESTLLIAKRQEAALTWQERFKLRFHTSICEPCTRFAEQVVLLDASLNRFFKAEPTQPKQLSDSKKADLERMIDENKS
jgi:hypothetical protein